MLLPPPSNDHHHTHPEVVVPASDSGAPPGKGPHSPPAIESSTSLPNAVVFVALGTTAMHAVIAASERLRDWVGRIPNCVRCFLIDAAAHGELGDGVGFVNMDVHGSGTDPHLGREIFYRARRKVRDAFMAHLDQLFRPDPLVALVDGPREGVTFVVVAGCGGTSGGSLHPMIDLIHEVASSRGVRRRHVHVVMIGPEVNIHDANRSVTPEQTRLMELTFTQNYARVMGDMAQSSAVKLTRDNGTTFMLNLSDRVRSVDVVDRSNGEASFASVHELTAMLGDSLFDQYLTPIGFHFLQRTQDHLGTGARDGNTL